MRIRVIFPAVLLATIVLPWPGAAQTDEPPLAVAPPVVAPPVEPPVVPPLPPPMPPVVIPPVDSPSGLASGWDNLGFGGYPGEQQASAWRGYGYLRTPGWTRYGYYGGWGYRAPGFSANFAPYAIRTAMPATVVTPPATLIIVLPPDAKLTIDERATTQTSDTRTFVARDLNPGYTYYYSVKAQVVRNGQTQEMTRRVAIRPGEVTRVKLEPLAPALTSR